MITVTFNFTDIAAAAALFAKLSGAELAAVVPHPLPRIDVPVEAATDTPTPAPTVGERMERALDQVPNLSTVNPVVFAEKEAAAPAPKPRKASAATPAASAPTALIAEAAVAAAHVQSTTEASPTTPPAAAPAASPAAEPFTYDKLQKLVFKLLPTHGSKLLEVAQGLGSPNFKSLPADKWQAAHDALVAQYGG